jgi:hypothetical protein
MKNIPSFNDFKKYESLLERANKDLYNELNSLEGAEPQHTVNEGMFLDSIKNSISKFFLGSLSRVGMIDKARKLLVDLEIDAIEKRFDFEESVDKLESQIDALSSINDKDRINALIRDRESKAREFEAFLKSHSTKVKKAKEFIQKAIESNPRRREYYEVGRSEDEVALAELEYKLAKEKADDSEIKKYEEKIKAKKQEAEEKAHDLKDKMDDQDKKSEESEGKKDLSLDPEKEKKKYSSRKAKDIIERKRQLEKDIADLRAEIERKLTAFEKKVKSLGDKLTTKYTDTVKYDLLELSSALDSKTNLLKILRGLGKSETEIQSKLSKEQEFTKLANLINQGITDGEDANSGTKKIISSVFITPGGKIDSGKIRNAKDKLNN